MAKNTTGIKESLLPYSDGAKLGSSESISKGNHEAKICLECQHSFQSCDCKFCLKCGSPFLKYFGTNIVKGRSHCRLCFSPICITCKLTIKGLEKVCTRCHLKQKEEEISTEKALSAIGEAKFGDTAIDNLSKLKTPEQKKVALFEAAKKGHDHVVVTLLNMGCDVNMTDASLNTPLFYAVEGGFLQCVVLLLEKGAFTKAVNNIGWTLLHAVAWKGTTERHLDVVELLLEMGVDPMVISSNGETASDVAERCKANSEIIQILKSAEVETSIQELTEKATAIFNTCVTIKEKRFGRLILSLLRFIDDMNDPKVQVNKTIKNKVFDLVVPVDDLPKTQSLDRSTIKKPMLCEKCGGGLSNPPCRSNSPLADNSTSKQTCKPTADVEPIIRSSATVEKQEKKKSVKDLEEKIQMLTTEKSEWEDRCRKLMTSIATATKEKGTSQDVDVKNQDHEKQVEALNEDLQRLKEDKDTEITKCEAAYSNKISKIRQETEISVRELEECLEESQSACADLLHLQRNYKLTWIPDDLIAECQQNKCRAPFSKTNRKHHCRCCGRVFCYLCSKEKVNLSILGYEKPVRVCNVCFALMDDIVTKPKENK